MPVKRSAEEEIVKVVVRVRPEANNDSSSKTLVIDENEKAISINRGGKKGVSEFTFSEILSAEATQEELYAECCGVVENVLRGINCCIMAYGQTGSGKTHSMLGSGWEDTPPLIALATSTPPQLIDNEDIDSPPLKSDEGGIIPRCVQEVYALLEKNSTTDLIDFSIHCQFMQIYNEKIYDLLQDRRREHPLQMRESARESYSSVYVAGLSSYRTHSVEDVFKLIRRGVRNRAVRGTEENSESSRSHSVLQLRIEVEGPDSVGVVALRRATLSLVDLAGSEKWRASLAQAGNGNLEEQKESSAINVSLSALGACVSALLEPGRRHIPYRNSCLTRLLQDAIGGEGRTVLLATVRDGVAYSEETLSTLQFAARAARIRPVVLDGPMPPSTASKGLSVAGLKKVIESLRVRVEELEQRPAVECVACVELRSKVLVLELEKQELTTTCQSLRRQLRESFSGMSSSLAVDVDVDGLDASHCEGTFSPTNSRRDASVEGERAGSSRLHSPDHLTQLLTESPNAETSQHRPSKPDTFGARDKWKFAIQAVMSSNKEQLTTSTDVSVPTTTLSPEKSLSYTNSLDESLNPTATSVMSYMSLTQGQILPANSRSLATGSTFNVSVSKLSPHKLNMPSTTTSSTISSAYQQNASEVSPQALASIPSVKRYSNQFSPAGLTASCQPTPSCTVASSIGSVTLPSIASTISSSSLSSSTSSVFKSTLPIEASAVPFTIGKSADSQSSTEPCQKHRLVSCVLCQLYSTGFVGSQTTPRSNIIIGLSSSPPGGSMAVSNPPRPQGPTMVPSTHSSSSGIAAVTSASNSPQALKAAASSFANFTINTTSTNINSSFLSNYRSSITSSLPNTTPISSFISTTLKAENSSTTAICATHNLVDCLLCRLRGGPMSSATRSDALPPLVPSIRSQPPSIASSPAQLSSQLRAMAPSPVQLTYVPSAPPPVFKSPEWDGSSYTSMMRASKPGEPPKQVSNGKDQSPRLVRSSSLSIVLPSLEESSLHRIDEIRAVSGDFSGTTGGVAEEEGGSVTWEDMGETSPTSPTDIAGSPYELAEASIVSELEQSQQSGRLIGRALTEKSSSRLAPGLSAYKASMKPSKKKGKRPRR